MILYPRTSQLLFESKSLIIMVNIRCLWRQSGKANGDWAFHHGLHDIPPPSSPSIWIRPTQPGLSFRRQAHKSRIDQCRFEDNYCVGFAIEISHKNPHCDANIPSLVFRGSEPLALSIHVSAPRSSRSMMHPVPHSYNIDLFVDRDP